MEGIVAAPAMHFGRMQHRPSRYLSTPEGQGELSRLHLLVREVSALVSHLFVVEKSSVEESSASPIGSNPEVAQDVTLPNAFNDGSLFVPYSGPSTTDPTSGSTCGDDFFKDELASLVHFFKDAEECPPAGIEEWLEKHAGLTTKANDQFQTENTTSDDQLPDYFDMPDGPPSPIKDMSNDWMVNEKTSPREGDDEIERGKHDQEPGLHGSLNLEPQHKDRQSGNELMSCIQEVLPWKLKEIEASYLSMLQDLKAEVAHISISLKEEVNRANENLFCHFDEMKRTVLSFLNAVQHVRKRLPKAIFRLIDMCMAICGVYSIKQMRSARILGTLRNS